MRVTEDDSSAHRDELVHEEQAALEHLLEDEDRAVAWVAPSRRWTSSRPGTPARRRSRSWGSGRRSRPRLADPGPAGTRTFEPEMSIRTPSFRNAGRSRSDRRAPRPHDHLAPRRGGETDEARDLDVVRADPELAAAELVPRGCAGRSSLCPRSARRARRGSGRGPGCAARRRRGRARSRPRRARRP